MPSRLIVMAGPDEGRAFPLGDDALLLGRSRATGSHLIDPLVSRVHCQVALEDGQFVLVDFDSPTGTFVNGNRTNRHVLQPGDLIRIGNTRLQFESADQETPAQPARKTALAPAEQELVGQKFSHYKIGPLLARGKTSYLHHARDTRRNAPVVLKVLKPEYSRTEEQVQRFVAMMKQVMPLRHAHLLKLYGAGKTGVHCWIAEEYMPCESLAAVIARIEVAGTLDWRQVLRVSIYLARALDYAHQKGILHLNVTPPNILLGKDAKDVKLTDLMVAAALEGDPTTPISAAGVPSEDLAYMPPERTHGKDHPVDARADVYGLGATMYALFTGHAPFSADTVEELVRKIRSDEPVSLKTHLLGVPDSLEMIHRQMLAKDPADRFQTVRSLLKGLELFAQSHGVGL